MTPIAPGVNEVVAASDPEPVTHMIESNVTGIASAARKMPVTTNLHNQDRNDGRTTHSMYFFGCERMTPPCLACAHSFFTCRQKIRASTTIPTTIPTTIRIVATGWAVSRP